MAIVTAVLFLQVTDQEKQQLFQAVQQYLMAAHLPKRDLPKRVIGVKELGEKRYQLHLEMGEGEGWFEVSWEKDHWTVKGIAPQR